MLVLHKRQVKNNAELEASLAREAKFMFTRWRPVNLSSVIICNSQLDFREYSQNNKKNVTFIVTSN